MKPKFWARWRANFVTGLVLVLPGVITLALLKWIFGTATSLTNVLLFFVPKEITRQSDGTGDMHWYWSLAALGVAMFLISLVGLLARYYVGKKIIASVESLMLRVPLLNKVYGTIKQVNEAFSSDRGSSFETVVLVQFPREGMYSMGFITSERHAEVQARIKEKIVSVFVPTTPNPTTGFLLMIPEDKVTRLDMPVADGIRFIISLGSVAPAYPLTAPNTPELAAVNLPSVEPPQEPASAPSP